MLMYQLAKVKHLCGKSGLNIVSRNGMELCIAASRPAVDPPLRLKAAT